jgi:hypothetical protein
MEQANVFWQEALRRIEEARRSGRYVLDLGRLHQSRTPPKSGKTTLLDALKGNPQPCDAERKETHGVDVITIEKPSPAHQNAMYLSYGDFAGQHIDLPTLRKLCAISLGP